MSVWFAVFARLKVRDSTTYSLHAFALGTLFVASPPTSFGVDFAFSPTPMILHDIGHSNVTYPSGLRVTSERVRI